MSRRGCVLTYLSSAQGASLAILFAVLCLSGAPAAADSSQDPFVAAHGDFFHLFFADRSDLNFTYRFEPQTEEDGGPGEYELQLFRLEGELPLPQNKDFFIRTGGVYEARSYDFSEVRRGGVAPSSEILHTAALRLGAGWFLGDDFLLTGLASLGAYSNFSGGVEEDDFHLLGEGLVVYRLNPGAQILAGAAYSEDFEDTDVLPLIGLRLLSEDGALHISLTIPKEATVTYAISPELRLYGGGWISGNTYNVEFDGEEFDVRVQDRRVGLGMQWWFNKHFRVSVEGGLLIDSELEFKTEETRQFEGDLEPSPYIGGGIGVSL